MPNETNLNIRVTQELKDKLQAMADADQRKLADFIRVKLMEIVKTSDKKK